MPEWENLEAPANKSFWAKLGGFFKNLGGLIKKGLIIAAERGLNDEIIKLTLKLAREAAEKFADNAEKREWVIRQLVARGLPEGVARIAVEIAVNLLKRELNKEQR